MRGVEIPLDENLASNAHLGILQKHIAQGIRPLLSLERLCFGEKTGQVCCPQFGGAMKIIAFLTDYAVVD
jgi:hypothetical protein